jgi:RNA polymerase sigma factor (sigma-70 family)
MDEHDWLAERFEEHRAHLRAVAYRMLGSGSEADDAVQEAWLRLDRVDASAVDNLGGWLTTVVGRVCLDMLRSRGSRREDHIDGHPPDSIVIIEDSVDPEQQVLLADSVGLALLVVLETLIPAERLAFVLHDMFGVPFEQIAAIVGRSSDAARQLASRARRRVQGATAANAGHARQREVVDAFFAAARDGDFDALVAVLDPDVVLRYGRPGLPAGAVVRRGAAEVARGALMFADPSRIVRAALVNGVPGVVITLDGRPVSVMAFTVADRRIVAIDVIIDRDRLSRIDLADLD